MSKEDDEIEKAVEEVDRMEDEAAAKREKEAEEGVEEEEPLVCCPKCKRPVTDGDYIDQFSNPMEDSLITKIECPQCGYIGLPVEIEPKDLKKAEKKD